MEFSLFLLCHFNGGMSLWHSQLLARQHGLLPVIPGWRRDFSTPWGELKARLPRLSKLFLCEMWNQDSHSRAQWRIKCRDISRKMICEFLHFGWGTYWSSEGRGSVVLKRQISFSSVDSFLFPQFKKKNRAFSKKKKNKQTTKQWNTETALHRHSWKSTAKALPVFPRRSHEGSFRSYLTSGQHCPLVAKYVQCSKPTGHKWSWMCVSIYSQMKVFWVFFFLLSVCVIDKPTRITVNPEGLLVRIKRVRCMLWQMYKRIHPLNTCWPPSVANVTLPIDWP